MFKPQWFINTVRAGPHHVTKRIRYIDRAATQDGGCFTAMVLMSLSQDGRYFVEHVEKGQWEPNERNDRIVAIAYRDRDRYGPKDAPVIYIEAERGSTGKESFQRIASRLAGFRVREDMPSGSKDVRAEPWADQLAAGNVFFVKDGTWDLDSYIKEHLAFRPAPGKRLGKFCDQVDASCLRAGTMVETVRGQKPIEEIEVGEFILTRDGYKEVEWSGCSGFTQELVHVTFSNGVFLEGTKEHLIWIQERGFVRMDSLRIGDEVIGSCFQENNTWLGRSLLTNAQPAEKSIRETGRLFVVAVNVLLFGEGNGREGSPRTSGSSSTDRRIPGDFLTGDTSVGDQTSSIERFGDRAMGTSPKDATSTTKMETLSIMTSQISNVLLKKNMLSGIRAEVLSPVRRSISREPVTSLPNGMGRRREGNGIGSMVPNLGLAEEKNDTNVFTVERSFSPEGRDVRMEENLDTARSPVERNGDRRMSGSRESVRNVILHSPQNLRRVGSAPKDVLHFSTRGSVVPVYDLSVKDSHEFFANGVLVHNSGSFNLLSKGKQQSGAFRVFTFKGPKTKGVKLLVCSQPYLEYVEITDHHSLLILLQDPPIPGESSPDLLKSSRKDDPPRNGESPLPASDHVPTSVLGDSLPPSHGLRKLQDTLTLTFADLDPSQHQDTWDDPILPWGLPCRDLMFTPEGGKKLWFFLTKRRDPSPDVWVIAGGDDSRALSLAQGICDVLRFPRKESIYCPEGDQSPDNRETQGEPGNSHVYDVVKTSRHLVM